MTLIPGCERLNEMHKKEIWAFDSAMAIINNTDPAYIKKPEYYAKFGADFAASLEKQMSRPELVATITPIKRKKKDGNSD